MRKNACGLDRATRFLIAATLAAVALGTSGGLRNRDDDVALWQILAMYVAGEFLVTGLLQWCPGNYLFGIDTCAGDRSWWRSFARSVGIAGRVDEPGGRERAKASIPASRAVSNQTR